MTKSIEAVIEGGAVRLAEPLAVADGTRVTVTFNDPAPPLTGRQAATMIRQAAANSERRGGVDDADVNADCYLYGAADDNR